MYSINIELLNTLDVDVEIIDCFKLGVGHNKAVVITVQTLQHKFEIFRAMKQLKQMNKARRQNMDIFINKYLPPDANQKKKQERWIYKENSKNESTKKAMFSTRKGLMVDNKLFEK